jgi:hypothetical protein
MENEARRRFPPPRSEEKEASSRDRANSNTNNNNNFFERFLKLSSLREKLELVKEKAERKRKQRRGWTEKKEERLCPLPNVIRVESNAGASSTSNASSSSLPEIWRARRQNLENCLQGECVKREKLREIVADGFVPDQPSSVRYDVWSYLLRVVPEARREREEERRKKRETYEAFAEELASCVRTPDVSVEMTYKYEDIKSPTKSRATRVAVELKVKQVNEEDKDILEQIERDVERLHPSLHFFNDEIEAAPKRKDMTEALFVFAKLNPGLRYVQGMHELLAPLYFVCFNHPDKNGVAKDAKSDSFWMFVELISELRDAYCKELDKTDQGINHLLSEHDNLLRNRCPAVATKMIDELNVKPQFYAFRWCVLMFAGEFDFPSVLRTFDFLVAWPRGKRDALLRLCSAMVCNVQKELLDENCDFAVAMRTLQNYPACDVNKIIKIACAFPYLAAS